MIMVVIGVAVVLVHDILAEDMVGERVALFIVVIVGHSEPLHATPARSHRPRRVIARRICQGQNAGRPRARHRSAVIPGRAEGASPESITAAHDYGFRAPSLRSGPGMTLEAAAPSVI